MINAREQSAAQRIAGPRAAPPWLKLEPGEELLASYQGKQIAEAVMNVTLTLLIIACLVALLMLVLGRTDKDAAGILTSIGGMVSGIGVSLGQLKKTQLHVTDKMLIFAQGKKTAGVPLGDVVAIRRGGGSLKWTLSIYVRGNNKPVGKITVLDTERIAAELAGYCQRGGAKLS